MASAVLTNSILFGVVRDRHCSKDSPKRIPIKNNKEFCFAVKETLEFLFSKPNQPLLLNQKTWTDERSMYLGKKFAEFWNNVCIV